MTDEQGYNGWTNYETWAVGMHLDGNYTGEGTCRFYEDLIAQHVNDGSAVPDLAEALKESVEDDIYMPAEQIPDNQELLTTGLVGDLLGKALSEVNWYELAETRLKDAA